MTAINSMNRTERKRINNSFVTWYDRSVEDGLIYFEDYSIVRDPKVHVCSVKGNAFAYVRRGDVIFYHRIEIN